MDRKEDGTPPTTQGLQCFSFMKSIACSGFPCLLHFMNILFTDTGWNQYENWQGQDKKIVKRINQLLKSIDRDGAMQGIGKPELLKYDKSGLYSRRIDETNRLVYEISGNQIIVKSCKGHYED